MGLSGIASAQNATTTTNAPTNAAVSDVATGHADLGGPRNVTAINGTAITLAEESNEGGKVYSVNAGAATITKNGVSSQLSAIAVGDKLFVQGTVSGSSVAATRIMDGR
jgi:hypothetical protein